MKPEEYRKLLIKACERHIKGIEIEKYKIDVKDYVPNTDLHYAQHTMFKDKFYFRSRYTAKKQHYEFSVFTNIMTLDRIATFMEMESNLSE
jgi:hypothetical protein